MIFLKFPNSNKLMKIVSTSLNTLGALKCLWDIWKLLGVGSMLFGTKSIKRLSFIYGLVFQRHQYANLLFSPKKKKKYANLLTQ